MWFAWDGSRIRLTHTRTRQKFANFAHEPRVALSIADPDDQYRFLEIRTRVEKIEDDPGRSSTAPCNTATAWTTRSTTLTCA